MAAAEKRAWSDLIIGLGLIALGGVIGADTAQMQVPPTYARVGPQVFPTLVSMGLALAGAYLALLAWRGRGSDALDRGTEEWLPVLVIAAGLIVHLNLLRPAGFVPAGIMLFMAVAFAFGSRQYLRDFAIAAVLVTGTYFGFTYGLGLQLPPGVLKGLI